MASKYSRESLNDVTGLVVVVTGGEPNFQTEFKEAMC